jgi:hypothetical protein
MTFCIIIGFMTKIYLVIHASPAASSATHHLTVIRGQRCKELIVPCLCEGL